MTRYLVFPVTVNTQEKDVKTRDAKRDGYLVDAENYSDAVREGSLHVPLYEGEQLAVVIVGKSL